MDEINGMLYSRLGLSLPSKPDHCRVCDSEFFGSGTHFFRTGMQKAPQKRNFRVLAPWEQMEENTLFWPLFRLITLYGKWLFLDITPFEPLNMVEYGYIFRHLIAIDQGFGIWYNFCSMTLLSDFIGWWSRTKNDKKPSESTKNLVFCHFWPDFTSL